MFASSFVAKDVATAFRSGGVVTTKRSQNNVTVTAKMSRIGKLPVQVPDKVNVTIQGNTVSVKVRVCWVVLYRHISIRQFNHSMTDCRVQRGSFLAHCIPSCLFLRRGMC